MNQLRQYRHSGKAPISSILTALIVGIIVAGGTGVAVAYGERYIPSLYLSVLAPIGAALASGASTGFLFRNRGGRHSTVAFILTTVTCLLAFYVSWVQWVSLHIPFTWGFWERFQSPQYMWGLAEVINKEGTWSFGRGDSEAVKGTFLWVIWGGEALIYPVCAWLMASASMKGVFCERCEIWTPSQTTVAVFDDTPQATQILDSFRRGDLDSAFNLVSVPSTEARNPVVTLRLMDECCQKCRRTRAISLNRHKLTIAKDGTNNEKSTPLFDRLLVTEDQAAILDSHLSKYTAKVQAAAAELPIPLEESPQA